MSRNVRVKPRPAGAGKSMNWLNPLAALHEVGRRQQVRSWQRHRAHPSSPGSTTYSPRRTELLPDAQGEVDAILIPSQQRWYASSLAAWGPTSIGIEPAAVVQSVVLNRTLRGLPSWIEPDGTVY